MNRMRVLIALIAAAAAIPLYAQKVLSEGVKELATQISGSIAKEKKARIAVVPFRELDGGTTVLGTYIAEELVTNLFNLGNADIVERTMLDKVMTELKLNQTGAIDQDTAKKLGKVAGVDAIVTGSITDLQSLVGVNCRLIDTETGKIFGAARAQIVKDDDVKKIMGMPMPGSPPPETKQSRSVSPATDGKGQPSWQNGPIHVWVESAQTSGASAVVTLVYEISGGGNENTRVLPGRFYLLDDNGDRWEEAWMYSDHDFSLLPGTRVRKAYRFNGKSGAGGVIAHEYTLIEDGNAPNLVLRHIRAGGS